MTLDCCVDCVSINEHSERLQAATDEYYAVSVKEVMVPVKVHYYRNLGMVRTFEPPTLEQVEKALNGSW